MKCPECSSELIVKNSLRQNGKQNFKCRACRRLSVEHPSPHYRIPESTVALADRRLSEKIPLAGIARSVKVSERWLQHHVNDKYESIPHEVAVIPKEKGRLTAECDEMRSFVYRKDNRQWIWLAYS